MTSAVVAGTNPLIEGVQLKLLLLLLLLDEVVKPLLLLSHLLLQGHELAVLSAVRDDAVRLARRVPLRARRAAVEFARGRRTCWSNDGGRRSNGRRLRSRFDCCSSSGRKLAGATSCVGGMIFGAAVSIH
jgi:hypothetical protein